MFPVKQKSYTGPLDKLLELIEEKKLEITEVSLAEVTADFLQYVKTLTEGKSTGLLADFLVVAARLLLIKSKVLLPEFTLTDDEEAAITDLESRLKIYRLFSARSGPASTKSSGEAKEKNAADYLRELWKGTGRSFSREYLRGIPEGAVFIPSEKLSSDSIVAAAERLALLLKEFLPQTQKVSIAIVTLEEKIKELLTRFTEAASHSFSQLKKQGSRTDAILLFLAVLHLLKEKTIAVEQAGQFGDIIVSRSETTKQEL